MTPFDIVNSINNKTSLEWDDVTEKTYSPFIINRGLSFNMQTIMFAAAMNKYPQLSKKMQYDFFFNGVPKGKRFDKWQKKTELGDDVKALQEFFNINIQRAEEALKLLSNEQLDMIKEKMKKGGRK